MIHIVTALQLEARPLIDHFELKRDNAHSVYEIFKNDEIALIVSGIGKVASASATTYLLSVSPTPSSIFNLGFCGAKIEYPIGELYLAHRITDRSTRKQYYSDLILRHDLNEASLETFDLPVTDSGFDDPDVDLVDMEAAGYFQAASRFLSPDRIYCLKIVSDHLDCGSLNKELSDSLIARNIGRIEKFMWAYSILDRESAGALSSSDTEILESVKSALRLSATQSFELKRLAMGYIASAKAKDLSVLSKYSTEKVNSKDDGKRRFNQLKESLK